MQKTLTAIVSLAWLCLAGVGWAVEGFEEGGPEGRLPPAWESSEAVKLQGTPVSGDAECRFRVALPAPRPEVVTVSGLVKLAQVRPKDESGQGIAAVRVSFLSSDGRSLEGPKKILKTFGTHEWTPWSGMLSVQAEAASLELILELKGAEGEVLFDDLEIAWGFPEDPSGRLLITDGGFEHVSPLSDWTLERGASIRFPGFVGRGALCLQQQKPEPAEASQSWQFNGLQKGGKIHCSFSARLEDVKARKQSGGAKAEILFFGSAGELLGRKALWGRSVGDRDWFRVEREVPVSKGASRGTLRFFLEDATGTAWFDEVALSGAAGVGCSVESKTDTAGWQPFSMPAGRLAEALDLSRFLDAPAGRHGFLKAQGDRFIFEDGTPVRFLGVNIQGGQALPPHEKADRLAERLSQLGFNLVRLHLIDADWAEPNLFDPAAGDTRHLSVESLERLDYFIAQLKTRGIYLYLDLLTRRQFTARDGVTAWQRLEGGAKRVAQYNRRLIDLQKEFARQLLVHRNPYTKMRLVDDPAIALVDLINESSLFQLPQEAGKIPVPYLLELSQRWADYLRQKGQAGESDDPKRYLDLQDPLVRRFYADLQAAYFQEMRDHLRALGLKVPVAGSNLSAGGWDLWTQSGMDFIDRHAYWDYPKGGYGPLVRFQNRSALESVNQKNLWVRLARQQVQGMPFVVGEWNIAWPNEFRAAGPLLMAAYALFQGWDGLLQFNYQGELEPDRIDGNFDISTKPELFLQMAVVARLFYQGEVEKGPSVLDCPILAELDRSGGAEWIHRVERVPDLSSEFQNRWSDHRSPWVSETGQLGWDPGMGTVWIDTPWTRAFIGRQAIGKPRWEALRFNVTNPFACLAVTSLDGQPVDRSSHLLLVAVARSENSGMRYNGTRTGVRFAGEPPILMEPVRGSVWVKTEGRGPARGYRLNALGQRAEEIRLIPSEGGFELSLQEGHLFEVLFEGSPG